jgi:hypothetical protein
VTNLDFVPLLSHLNERANPGRVSDIFMSSTTTDSRHTMTTPSNLQFLVDAALRDYTNLTKIDLSHNPFAEIIQHLSSPDEILELIEEREKAFKEYREGNRRLMRCLSPAVRVLHACSGIIGEAVSAVSTHTPLH